MSRPTPLRKALRQYRKKLRSQGIVSMETALQLFNYHKLGKPAAGYEKNDGFYESRQWRELRYEALKNSKGECVCCGASRKNGAVLHVDHIKPRYKHPELALDVRNLQVLCSDCNRGKGAWDSTDFRK